jgi:hypothetical protein
MQAISTQWVKSFLVIPAKAGIQGDLYFWIPAFAGMTKEALDRNFCNDSI